MDIKRKRDNACTELSNDRIIEGIIFINMLYNYQSKAINHIKALITTLLKL